MKWNFSISNKIANFAKMKYKQEYLRKSLSAKTFKVVSDEKKNKRE